MSGPDTLAAAQQMVDETIRSAGGYWPPLANLARLFEECGELARGVNQVHGPKERKSSEDYAALPDELGDVLYTALVLANSLGIDAGAALAASIDKVRQRNRSRAEKGGTGSAMP